VSSILRRNVGRGCRLIGFLLLVDSVRHWVLLPGSIVITAELRTWPRLSGVVGHRLRCKVCLLLLLKDIASTLPSTIECCKREDEYQRNNT